MPVPDPAHLLEQAERLAAAPAKGQPRDADLRRAISTAYYAIFHAILTAAADSPAACENVSTLILFDIRRLPLRRTFFSRGLPFALLRGALPELVLSFLDEMLSLAVPVRLAFWP